MPTKRRETAATSSLGVNFVRSLVERHNCTFQKIDLENDLGNDAYIEFVRDQETTGCCVAAQIKSGVSYVSNDRNTFFLRADKPHFEYWAIHALPVAGVVFDPATETAAWCDITEHLRRNPRLIEEGPYDIPIPSTHILDSNTFPNFMRHFLEYQASYQQDQSFGRALELFADRAEVRGCANGLWSLFSFHRQRPSTWHYLISSLRHFRNHQLLRLLVTRLAHIPGHMDIFWSHRNIIDAPVEKAALSFMRESLCREDFLALLECIDENGLGRGSIGQCVLAIIDTARQENQLLKSIVFDMEVAERTRGWALCLLVDHLQRSKEEALRVLRECDPLFSTEECRGRLEWMRDSIVSQGGFTLF